MKLFSPILFLFLTFLFSFRSSAQVQKAWSSGEILEGIKKLQVLGSVLYIAAHPDDENTRLITYLSREKLYRTGYLSLTRGDGGQNLIGDEIGVELGLIRTQELLAARRIDGGEQFFSRAFDFGYSKTPEETLEKWGHETILHDVVWVIRKFQPDVVITRFPTTGEGGHGHHTSSAILANEAFDAAADPSRFPEQLKYVQPWQAKRLLWNTFNFGNINTISDDQFKIEVGGYNAALGASYGEIAAKSRSQHKSQGFGMAAQRGESFEWFATTKGSVPTHDVMDEVITNWKRVPQAKTIEKDIRKIEKSFKPNSPELSVSALVQLYKKIQALPEGYWRTQKSKEVTELILQCSGIYAEAFSRTAYVAQSDSAALNFSIISRLSNDWKLTSISTHGFDTILNQNLQRNKSCDLNRKIEIPASAPVTQPYWLAEPMKEGSFVINDEKKIGQPDVDPSVIVDFTVQIKDVEFIISRPVWYKFTDPVKGEIYQPLVVLPAVEVQIAQPNILMLPAARPASVNLSVKSNTKNASSYTVDVKHSRRFSSMMNGKGYVLTGNQDLNISISRTDADNNSFLDKLELSAKTTSGAVFSAYRREISYDHIPHIIYFPKAAANLVGVDLKNGKGKIGYIVGAGDKVPEALESMGYEVTMLGNKELERTDLSQFHAILTGIRAYNTNDWMNAHFNKLMQYVENGGRLIVQYVTSSNIGPLRARIAPYDFEISRTRVTKENAKGDFLIKNDSLFNYPHAIQDNDFEFWVQERSIYHAGKRDASKFDALISMADPGEPADDGALIRTKYGKGQFIYTGLTFFRQLPAGVPGAYRLISNLIGL